MFLQNNSTLVAAYSKTFSIFVKSCKRLTYIIESVSLIPCIRNLVNFKMEAGLSSNTCHMYPYANDMRYRCGVLFSFICFRVLPEPLIQISKPAPHFLVR